MKDKFITGDKLKKGMVVQYQPVYGDLQDPFLVEHDRYGFSNEDYKVLGKVRRVKLPGSTYFAGVLDGTLYVGCQRIDAVKAFKNLGKALGYEVTG